MKKKLGIILIILFVIAGLFAGCASMPKQGDNYIETAVLDGVWIGNNERTLSLDKGRYKIFVTANPSDVRGQGSFKVDDEMNPTSIYFSYSGGWVQSVTVSGNTLVLKDRPNGAMPNILGGTYTKQ